MNATAAPTCTAFNGHQRFASGTLASLAPDLKVLVERTPDAQILIFDDNTGAQLDLNLQGSLDDVLARLPRPAGVETRAAGRPKLGVVGREVTLLPRHWDWLNAQPGGASVALRKLVEQGLRDNQQVDRQRVAREGAYRFISALAGDQPGFEEASRALFAGDRQRYVHQMADWPADVRQHALVMAEDSFA